MRKYIYIAKDRQGNKVTGEVEASNLQLAAKLVRERGYVVIKIKPARKGILGFFKSLKSRVTGGDLATFTRQFSTMINAGLPVTESLSILRIQSKASLQPIVSQVLADVEAGESLSTAFGKHKNIFSPTYIALIKAGEAGGVLAKVLERLADNLEKAQEFKAKVKGALIYPAIIVIGMIVVGIIMMVFVIPRLLDLYTEFGAELPLPTKILMAISNGFSKLWPVILVLLVGGIVALSRYRKTKIGKRKIDEFILKIPVFGDLQRQIILTELTRTLALMVGTGVSIIEGLRITSEVSGNAVISEALDEAAFHVEKGFPIAFSFAQHPQAFPYLLSQMIAVGEETGQMEDVLMKVSRVFEVESEQKVKALTSSIEPAVMVVLGIGVAFLVISVILPIYNLTTQF